MTDPAWSIVAKNKGVALDKSTIQFIGPDDTLLYEIDLAELHNLVDDWEDFADPAGWDAYSDGVRDATQSCADDLATVLSDGGDQ